VSDLDSFTTLAELLRGVHRRFLRELEGLGATAIINPHTGTILGSIAGMINASETLKRRLEELERAEPAVHAAFRRALENS
jgi:hypothetical protein